MCRAEGLRENGSASEARRSSTGEAPKIRDKVYENIDNVTVCGAQTNPVPIVSPNTSLFASCTHLQTDRNAAHKSLDFESFCTCLPSLPEWDDEVWKLRPVLCVRHKPKIVPTKIRSGLQKTVLSGAGPALLWAGPRLRTAQAAQIRSRLF